MSGSGSLEHVMLVVPVVREPRRLEQVARDAMRLERLRSAGDDRREIEQRLDQLALLRLVEHREIDAVAASIVAGSMPPTRKMPHMRACAIWM